MKIQLIDTSSNYTGNGGYKGIISVNGTNALIINAIIIDSISKYGSILHIINNGTVQFTNPTLLYGKSR